MNWAQLISTESYRFLEFRCKGLDQGGVLQNHFWRELRERIDKQQQQHPAPAASAAGR